MKTILVNTNHLNIPSFEAEGADTDTRILPTAREAEGRQERKIVIDTPRTVIREYGGKVQSKKVINLKQL